MAWTGGPGRMWRRLRGSPPEPPEPLGEPVHHTMLAVGIEDFAAPERTNTHRLRLRAGLYGMVERALTACGVPWSGCHRADLGDGVLVLAPAAAPKAVFGELVPAALTALLAGHNRAQRPPERMRLRAALHAGEVSHDAHGTTGAALVHVFRLHNSAVLREALAEARGDLAVIASAWFYAEVIQHSPASSPESYRPVFVAEKETAAPGWIRVLG